MILIVSFSDKSISSIKIYILMLAIKRFSATFFAFINSIKLHGITFFAKYCGPQLEKSTIGYKILDWNLESRTFRLAINFSLNYSSRPTWSFYFGFAKSLKPDISSDFWTSTKWIITEQIKWVANFSVNSHLEMIKI